MEVINELRRGQPKTAVPDPVNEWWRKTNVPRLPPPLPKITTPLSASLITERLSDSWSGSETHSETVSLAPKHSNVVEVRHAANNNLESKWNLGRKILAGTKRIVFQCFCKIRKRLKILLSDFAKCC